MAFTFIAIHHPKPEHRAEVLRSMQRVGDVLSGSPGLVQIGPWTEEDGNRVIGISVWESRDAFERALQAVGRFSAAGSQDRSREEWEEQPTEEIFAESA